MNTTLRGLVAPPSNLAASFGRIGRSYPNAMVPVGDARVQRLSVVRDGMVAAVVGFIGCALVRLGDTLIWAGEAHARRRLMRLATRALSGLEPRTLRDIGITADESTSVAAEHTVLAQAQREPVWRAVGAYVC